MEALQRETAVREEQVVSLEMFRSRYPDPGKYNKEIVKERERLEQALPESMDPGDCLLLMERRATENKLRLTAIRPEDTEPEGGMGKCSVHMSLQCGYFELLDFLDALQSADRFIQFRQLHIKRENDRLNCELAVAVFADSSAGNE